MMMNRRTLFAGSTAAAMTATSSTWAGDGFHDFDVEDRGSIGIFERTPVSPTFRLPHAPYPYGACSRWHGIAVSAIGANSMGGQSQDLRLS